MYTLVTADSNRYTTYLDRFLPSAAIMISDDDLYSLAVFLGCLSMLLIILYHFLEVNAKEDDAATKATSEKASQGTTPANSARAVKS
ncbi:MAG: hypothetical protein LQ338_005674 [Usnochroma carphineum]|nr:MAG: hypothetical protein LQ338_005674 [Usnochroma carphineum]